MRFKYLASLSALTIAVLSTNSNAVEVVSGESVFAAPDASAFDWSGVYVGVNAGGGFGEFKDLFDITLLLTDFDGTADLAAGGILGGVQAGYNWQSGQLIYGVEADFQGSDVKGKGFLDARSGPSVLAGRGWTDLDWFGTVRARIGYTPVDRVMMYATGGLAYGHIESFAAPTPSISATNSDTMVGWTLGAGVEYALTDNWTLKSEYLYTDLGKSTLYNGDLGVPLSSFNFKNDVAFHTVRVGLNYKF